MPSSPLPRVGWAGNSNSAASSGAAPTGVGPISREMRPSPDFIKGNDEVISLMHIGFMRILAHASLARLMTPATPTQLASSYSLTRRVRTCTRSRPSGPSRLAGTEHNTNARMRAEAVADQLLIPFWSAGSSAIAALAACLDGFLSNAARCAQSEQSTSRRSTACRPSVRARPGTPTRTLASRGRWRGGSRAPRRRRQRLR
jgi:hypothetical protein